ncbi:MAG TPA: hypothetical protein VHJ82_00075, partial [Actinomycetota bacterium]|nr:hypothetical protein [Actinomycetota bacterium]
FGTVRANFVEGSSFSPASTVTLEVFDAPDGTLLFSDAAVPTNASGSFFRNLPIELAPGMHVRVTDNGTSEVKTLTLATLTVDSLQHFTDTVFGTAPPNAPVSVEVLGPGCSTTTTTTAGGDGRWSADFTGLCDLTRNHLPSAATPDSDGDETGAFLIPRRLRVSLVGDLIIGDGFTPNNTVSLEVLDAPEGASLFSNAAVPTDGSGLFSLIPPVDLVGGMHLVVTDNATGFKRELTLPGVTFDLLDIATDIAFGSAPPGTQLSVFVNGTNCDGVAETTSDAAGIWSVDFTSQCDVNALHTGVAIALDDDADETLAHFTPRVIDARLTPNAVQGTGFTPSDDVAVQIFDAPGGNLLAEDLAVATDASGGFFFNPGIDLVPGQHIVVTDNTSGDVKELTTANLTMTLDPVTDVASGTAEPGGLVSVLVFGGGCFFASAETTADAAGVWSIDFTSQCDVTADTDGFASTPDADRDLTGVNFS